MTLGTSNRQIRLDHFLRMVLSVVFVFAILHVSSHDLDISDDTSSTEECQVCRLNNVSFAALPVPLLVTPLLLSSLVISISTFQQPTLSPRHTFGARAPPLF